MDGLRRDLEELRLRLGEGSVQRAYVAIVTYLSGLRTTLASEDRTASALYQGYFDMTYFALVTPALKARNLKLAVVFDYPSFRFEVWLAGRNRAVQSQYWQLLAEHGWPADTLVRPAVGVDAIVAVRVADGLELDDSPRLTERIDHAVDTLLHDVERFLERHDPLSL